MQSASIKHMTASLGYTDLIDAKMSLSKNDAKRRPPEALGIWRSCPGLRTELSSVSLARSPSSRQTFSPVLQHLDAVPTLCGAT
jgi:hypothetical protein